MKLKQVKKNKVIQGKTNKPKTHVKRVMRSPSQKLPQIDYPTTCWLPVTFHQEFSFTAVWNRKSVYSHLLTLLLAKEAESFAYLFLNPRDYR